MSQRDWSKRFQIDAVLATIYAVIVVIIGFLLFVSGKIQLVILGVAAIWAMIFFVRDGYRALCFGYGEIAHE